MPRTQLLIINADIEGAARVKQALEGTRRYTVTPFADSGAAMDFLREHRQDAAIVDMHMASALGPRMIATLRETQPDLTIVASTSDSNAAAAALNAGATQLLDGQFTARDVVNLLEKESESPETVPGGFVEPKPAGEDSQLFEKLAAEEPPRPTLEETGTVTDFMAISPQDLDTMFSNNPDPALDEMVEEEWGEDTAARLILETANDDSVPMDQWDAAERGGARERVDYVTEPDFLMDARYEDFDALDDLAAEDQSTAPIRIEEDTHPSDGIATLEPLPEDDPTLAEPQPEPGLQAFLLTAPDEGQDEGMRWLPNDIEVGDTRDDPRLTQLAVSLTQASLESTAEATLLTRGNTFVAYDGMLSETDVDELLQVIVTGWADVGEQNARIRYVTLSSNGLDYMLYSRRTHEDFILSMVFAGHTALRDIRQQAKRIVTALQNVPEMEDGPAVDDNTTTETGGPESRGGLRLEAVTGALPFVRHTFVWLLRDPNEALAYATAEAVNAGLRVQLIEQGWQVDVLDVAEDYVYLVAGVPSDEPPQTMVRDLQTRSARIARAQDPNLSEANLWAESYFVLSPGRELNLQEIQQYINFYRM
jgi:ActR/RegA family two-component response regulator/REP element-mobilizing transposase RayT